jgi:splicing factor 1
MRMLTCGRQRGANWRNDGPGGPGGPPGPTAGRIGTGDAVDREYEVSSTVH